MTAGTTTWHEIEARMADLPPDDLPKVLEYVEFLAFKHQKVEKDEKDQNQIGEQKTPYRVVAKLGGLLKDYPISDEEIAAARKEMWARFGDWEP